MILIIILSAIVLAEVVARLLDGPLDGPPEPNRGEEMPRMDAQDWRDK